MKKLILGTLAVGVIAIASCNSETKNANEESYVDTAGPGLDSGERGTDTMVIDTIPVDTTNSNR